MFDNIKVLKLLPLTEEISKLGIRWEDEIFQTKDLDNLLGLYEIGKDGKLRHLIQNKVWKECNSTVIPGTFELQSEHWEEVPFHGIIRFYTSYCDRMEYNCDLISWEKEMSWQEIFEIEGYDWWVEFLAIINNGICTDIKIDNTHKSPISTRLAKNKELTIRREIECNKPFNKLIRNLRKIKGYKSLTRIISRGEQNCHEKLRTAISKIS